MLGISVDITEAKVVLSGLVDLYGDIHPAIDSGLVQIAKGTTREAYLWLSGPNRPRNPVLHEKAEDGGKGAIKRRQDGAIRYGRRGQSSSLQARPGSYPVPVVTGNLRRLLDWVAPGRAKGGFVAGAHEVVVYDSADYAFAIHEGEGSSSGNARRFLEDGFNRFNDGAGAAGTIDNAIGQAIRRRGF